MARQLKRGKYAGLPWIGCPYCSHGLAGDDASESRMNAHIVHRHPNELRAGEVETMAETATKPGERQAAPGDTKA